MTHKKEQGISLVLLSLICHLDIYYAADFYHTYNLIQCPHDDILIASVISGK